MAAVSELIELLELALRDPSRRREHVRRFQDLVWSAARIGTDSKVEQVLRTLVYDLDFFEPDERLRAEDPSYYGESRLLREIQLALQQLGQRASDGSA